MAESTMISHFIEQVQILMEIQQVKLAEAENWNEKSKYIWLCSKKVSLVILSLRQECKIRQALTKVTVDQQIEILRKLMKFIDDNPGIDVVKIPQAALDLIDNTVTINLVNEINFSRMNSFRRTFSRRFSIKIAPDNNATEKARCVTFKDKPIVYKISK